MEAIASVVFFILFFAARDQLHYFCNVPGNSSACDPGLRILGALVPDPVFPTVTAVLAVLAVIGILLIGHLTCFHFYLSKPLSVIACTVHVHVPRYTSLCMCMCKVSYRGNSA